ncbi:hypothetical protein B0H10DRAFT_2073166 [Mycena sp. CBHHK59/15]|nr:hypothetical protein B0H10DRAFT_2073166 [Mycena sp. CBHHK59/15]
MSKNADWQEQEFNAHLGFPPLPSSQMPTYGFGDDAEYFYDYQGPQSTPTNLPILRTDPSHLTYPPPSQPSADFAARRLAEMNKLYAELPERAASSSPFGPLREMAMNLPRGPIPSFHADSTTDDTRKLIGQSTAKLPTGSKSKQRSAGQEVVAAEPKAPARPVFAGPDLVQLARAVAHKQFSGVYRRSRIWGAAPTRCASMPVPVLVPLLSTTKPTSAFIRIHRGSCFPARFRVRGRSRLRQSSS